MDDDIKKNVGEPYNPSESNDLTLSEIGYWLTQNFILIMSITAIFSIGSIIYSLNATKVYTAETTVISTTEESNGGLGAAASGLTALTGISLSSGSEVSKYDEYMAILQSKKFLIQFFKDHGLNKIMYPGYSYSKSVDKFLSNNFSVNRNIRTGITTLSFSWTDPVKASEWLNQIALSLNEAIRQKDLLYLKKRVDRIKEQLDVLKDIEQKEILFKILSQQMSDINIAESRKEYAIKIIDPSLVPEERSYPRRTRIVIFWSLMGLVIGVISAFVLSLFSYKKES